ncbi:MAG: double-strand break repair helicase AddA [Alphaproteobacteria bacterium]|nr:double-strand break repair helicase AddA [Alphaproteobacteria bacterium]
MPHQLASTSQRIAAHPHHSAWVAASAGSGKTKVLTDRVLNLLLEGCAPERILCLTFTKAAAAEMANRVRARLGEWAILNEKDLRLSLETLQGHAPTPEKTKRARHLFSLILDAPGGLKIQTIHSFCQALLKRFPLEAGLSPFFEIADVTEQAKLRRQASHAVIETAQDLILKFSEDTLEELTHFVLENRSLFHGLSPQKIEEKLGVVRLTKNDLFKALLNGIPQETLKKELIGFSKGSPTDQERGEILSHFLNLPDDEKIQNYETYVNVFLTQQGETRARLLTQNVALNFPHLKEIMEAEVLRVEAWKQKENALTISHLSKAFLSYSTAFLKVYEKLKKELSLLDYDDLILKTVELLKNPGCHWVLYKLDGGLDHILVDEAQDTNPAQWQVIRALAEEFYANAATETCNRTLFVVGDGKQSIYSFQGADPAVFTQMQNDLRRFASNSGKKWEDIDLNVSFRSTPEILSTVDAVFSIAPLSSVALEHHAFRKNAPGHVELWPLLKKEEKASLSSWQPALDYQGFSSPQKKLAHQIAKTIQGWLSGQGPLTRPTAPGDILILVRRRTSFVDKLIKALKELDIPVAGIDRLWLLEGIGVQDLLKIAEFLLLPEDDLTLATVLKGPLFNFSEEDLFVLAQGRENKSLWQRLQTLEKFKNTRVFLEKLLSQVDFLTPFALFSQILGPLEGRKKWHTRLGPEVLDSLDEFLNLCLLFQEKETPSLQNFLAWVSQETIELKRDLDQSNQVRIMTVHGSKGLQAPIVFLPDTTQAPVDMPPFAFFEDTLLWLPPNAQEISLTKEIKQHIKLKQQEEYNRLLYVALTRAEDALYVCGWEAASQNSWYDMVKAGLQKVGEEFDFREGKGLRLSSPKKEQNNPYKPSAIISFSVPQWLKTPPLPETLPLFLTPSKLEGEEIEFHHTTLGEFGTRRGTLIHKLLEFLPSLPTDLRERAAERFLEKEDIPQDLAQEMIETTLKVLNTYPDFYTPSSLGEVPFEGKLGDHWVSGQIDRLVIMEEQILIIDYKTHREAPSKLEDIPPSILKQMVIYRDIVTKIYTEHAISCGILWTSLPRFDVLPHEILKGFSSDPDLLTNSLDLNNRCAYFKGFKELETFS